MTDTSLRRHSAAPDLAQLAELGLAALILVALGLKLHLVFVLNINWDEFLFLSLVHEQLRGDLTAQFQTFHVHLFSWLPLVAETEVDQVIAGRLTVYTLGLGACLFTYLIARLFFARLGALFSVLCLLSLHNVVLHGSSFRSDPIAACLMLGAVYALLRQPRNTWSSAAAGTALALALIITVKSAIYLPMIAAIFLQAWLSGRGRKAVLAEMATFVLSLTLAYLALYAFHLASLPAAQPQAPMAFAGSAASKVIVLEQFFPQWRFFLVSLLKSFWVWALLAIGMGLVVAGRRGADGEGRWWLPLSFLLPLLSLLLYRNAYPYFYVFIISPAIVLCGAWVSRMAGDFASSGAARPLGLAGLLTMTVAAGLFGHYQSNASDSIAPQRELVQLVHRLFPEPVAYIDRNGTISSFPRPVFFMSTWGLEHYRDQGMPVMRRVLTAEQPRFLIANSPVLDLSRSREAILAGYGHALLAEDFQVLRDNFIPHWGLLYVPGKRIALEGGGKPREFEILVPGRYTLEGADTATIGGTALRPGDTLELSAGRHAIHSNGAPAQVTLRWGDHLYRPPGAPSEQAFFARF